MSEIILPHDHGMTNHELLEHIPERESFEKTANVFALISDATRLKILWLLCHSEECVANISATVQMTPPAVSHHLRILRQAELLKSRREGKEVYYTLADNEGAELVHHVVDHVFNLKCGV
ncbi:MAG: metalloregulator ArsR/SmtB family transcription factor [Clostridia bacterium]|nr:metalloregulator ArsR/SmtB family transcription factor [Clostridia bacterium]